VTWIDVGQGDAAIVELPGGKTLLVDCGGASGSAFDIGRRVIEQVAWARGVARFDYLAVTHTDADHVNGAPVVTEDFRPAEVWEGVAVEGDTLREDLARAAAGIGATWRTVQRGDRMMAGGALVTVWHPPPADWERRRVRNDDSIVVEIRFGDVSVILPGDVEAEAEADLAAIIGPAPLRVVQAAHHGSATSTTEGWLDAVTPDAVVISTGRGNRYGHPHAAVLARLERRQRPVFRTDRDGAVTLETDGSVVEVTTFTGRRWRAGPRDGRRRPPAR
jgi:competence protein ComEC